MSLKLAILASGSGTNAQAMIDKVQAKILDVEIVLIVSNRPGAQVLTRAQNAHIPNLLLDHTAFPSREAYDAALLEKILASNAEAVALAGYMRLLSAQFLHNFPGSVLNLHPAILPSFAGLHGAKDAKDYGVKISGATVHFVDEKMDNGPVIIQAAVPVKDSETLEELMTRIHTMEHRIYPQALQWLAEKRLSIHGRTVHLAHSPKKPLLPEREAFVWPPLEEGF